MPNLSSGISSQFGVAEEPAYGTLTTPSRFWEYNNETIKNAIARMESKGLRAGFRGPRSGRWAPGKHDPKGDVSLEVQKKSMGLLFKHMFGAFAITTPTGGTLSRDHTYTPGDLTGLSLTAQISKPAAAGGTPPAFTYTGCKVNEWELMCGIDTLLDLKLMLVAQEETTATALAAASYPTPDLIPFNFIEGSIQIAGSPVGVISKMTLTGKNGLDDSRFHFGAATRNNPLEKAWRDYGGTMEAEFNDLTAYGYYVNGQEVALDILFQGPIIEGALHYELEITANVRFDGETPEVRGPEILKQNFPFKCLSTAAGGDAAMCSLRYRTTDVAP